MKIALSGSRGLVGSALAQLLTSQRHEVIRLVRSKDSNGSVFWDPNSDSNDLSQLDGVDAVIHLAGENIASGRWDAQKKNAIRTSRVNGTKSLSAGLAKLKQPPKVLLCASAIGYYGDRGQEELDEKSKGGAGFLSNVCQEWEQATLVAKASGMRVVNLRIGVVLSPKGGALAKMLPPFMFGAGGQIGDGKQYMSWIAIDDVASAINYCLTNENISGPVNLVAPEPVTNSEFTQALGKVLHRPTFCPVPDFAARLAFGEMADALLLASVKVKPRRLQESGYQFLYPSIEPALRHVLNR